MKTIKIGVAVAALVLATATAPHAELDSQAFLDTVVAAIVDSDYTGDDLGRASSITLGRDYTFSCIEYRAAVLSSDRLLNGSAVGMAFGVADTLAQIHCFVGDGRCRCLRDWPVGNPTPFATAVGNKIATCQRDRPAAGAIQEAVMQACR